MRNLYLRLAKTNLKNNKALYLPYIISGIMTVAMFYLMMFLNNNDGLDMIPGSASLKSIMALGVVVIAVFAYIFIFYTNSFIIKRRKKEIGVYNILGMEKRHIAKVLALETLFTAVIAILGGLFAGIVFSKLALMLLYRILGYKESIVFSITGSAIINTLIVFGLLYVLTLLYNLMQIKLSNPIELLHGSNVGEKEPKTKWLMTILGLICIIVAYGISITIKDPLGVILLFFVAVILVIVGTFLLFTSGSIALLKALRKNKNFYYDKRHFTAISGMLYRMKQNAAGLASICILSTMVLVMISTTVSMYAGVNDELTSRFPSEICIYVNSLSTTADMSSLEQSATDAVNAQGRTITGHKSYASFNMYMSQDGQNFTGDYVTNFEANASYVTIITRENLIAMDDSLTEDTVPEVPTGSVAIYSNVDYAYDTITICNLTYPVAGVYDFSAKEDLYISGMMKGCYYVVVDNEQTLENLFLQQRTLYGEKATNYVGTIGIDINGSPQEKIDCAKAVSTQLEPLNGQNESTFYTESRQSNEQEFFSLYGGLFFLGIFLGIMFLMVTVMIIFYKQISEGFDDKERYQIMEKVGMSAAEVKVSIQSQIRLVFFLPLLTAAVHVAAAFPMIRRLLALLNLTNTTLFITCLIATICIFAVIYYLVFKLTSSAYYKIVGNQVR